MSVRVPQDDFLPWPTCDRCKKPVERMSRWESMYGSKFVFRAHCHGETEDTELTHFQLMELRSIHQIEPGVAFRGRPALPSSSEDLR